MKVKIILRFDTDKVNGKELVGTPLNKKSIEEIQAIFTKEVPENVNVTIEKED